MRWHLSLQWHAVQPGIIQTPVFALWTHQTLEEMWFHVSSIQVMLSTVNGSSVATNESCDASGYWAVTQTRELLFIDTH